MHNAFPVKAIVGVLAVVLIGLGLYASGVFGPQGTVLAGIDVRNTACEDLSSARLAVATELGERKAKAEEVLARDKDKVSDDYWTRHQELEKTYRACISRALTADPCKEPSDRITALYEEIMADFAADKGFNEAKFNEREEAKKEYAKCVEETHKPEFYKDKEAQCEADFAAAKEQNLTTRNGEEAAAQAKYTAAVAEAERAHGEKQAILDAIEKKCTEPGETSQVSIGPLTTELSGAAVQPNSSSCTGIFPGNDPTIARQIAQLEAQLQKAKVGGQSGGLFGTDHVQEALDRLRQELSESPRACKVDADCGSTVPVCCSATEVGTAFCDAGFCSAKKTTCTAPEICAGKPAQCIAPMGGAVQGDGIYITRTIPEVGTCSQNLQTLDLTQATPESVRYEIVGNIPGWLHIDKPGGPLPGKVTVTYSCATVQKMGPGTHTVTGSLTVYTVARELINTIPLTVAITVTPAPVEMVDAIEYNGKFLPTAQLIVESEEGCTTKHWHAASGVVTATDGTKVSDPGPQCGYGKLSDKPVKKVPAISRPSGQVEIRGLDGLKQQ